MALKPLLMGYTSKCFIGGIQVFLTSYSLSINTNVIKSNGISKIKYNTRGFERMSLNAIRDCPSYQLSLSFQATYQILFFLFDQLINFGFHKSISVQLNDKALGLEGGDNFFNFEKCYVNNFSVSVDADSVVVVNLGLSYFSQEFKFEQKEYNESFSKDEEGSSMSGGDLLIPYYNTSVQYKRLLSNEQDQQVQMDDFKSECLQNFSFDFSHTITPKYSLMASKNDNKAFIPQKLVFSIPTVNYNLSYIYYDNSFKVDDYTNLFSGEIATKGWELTLYFLNTKGNVTLTCQNCYHNVFTPNIGSKGNVNMLNISGTVYGKIRWS